MAWHSTGRYGKEKTHVLRTSSLSYNGGGSGICGDLVLFGMMSLFDDGKLLQVLQVSGFYRVTVLLQYGFFLWLSCTRVAEPPGHQFGERHHWEGRREEWIGI